MQWGRYKWKLVALVIVLLTIAFYVYPPDPFQARYSTVLEARNGELLCASIAADGQWRFPQGDSIPNKFKIALVAFEDKRFYSHPGVDILSLARATRQNLKAGKIVSGGSTITMQVIRLSRNNQSRSFVEKIKELALATRLEIHFSKDEILGLYAAHAPFGGNVVGIEAAAWRYFGTDASDLSWAQACMLAVLPNAPSLIHLGKNRGVLKAKRDRLLRKLKEDKIIDETTCALAIEEPIPDEPYALPRHARHMLVRMSKDGLSETKLLSTIDYGLQSQVEAIIDVHHQRLAANQIYNAAALVLDVKTGEVLSYCGNINTPGFHESEVDVIGAPRSTGSILKPFLFAALMDEGRILPTMLLPDVPVQINGFSPRNFSHEYDGAVPANKALIRSLNVPAVNLLRDYRYERFHSLLKNMGMTTLKQSPDHYGLSLILGGAEGTLWDFTGMYASMARSLENYFNHPGAKRYRKSDYHSPRYTKSLIDSTDAALDESTWVSASSSYLTFEMLKDLFRPGEETGWRHFSSSKVVAWKTGTSFGFRDGWAIGVNAEYAVGVWVGNADGEGRPGLTGTDAASPLMFDIFSRLPGNQWFQRPNTELQEIPVCSKSGYRISENCEHADTILIAKSGLVAPKCPFHKNVHLSKDLKFQVHDECASVNEMKHMKWFVLPPVQELYYKHINISYKTLPPYRADCSITSGLASMDMVYPKNNARIFIPRELNGEPGKSVFELAHRNSAITVFWHLDGKYIGSTKNVHHLELHPPEGRHVLTAVDEAGEILERRFEVISKM